MVVLLLLLLLLLLLPSPRLSSGLAEVTAPTPVAASPLCFPSP
jgi:hypothetical protein